MKRTLGEGKYLRLVKEDNWEWAERHHQDTAAVLPITNDQKIVFITQYRVPVKSMVVEIPAGLVGDVRPGETCEDAIKAELLEEAGYEARGIEEIGHTPASPGLTNECTRLYVASRLKKVSEGGGDKSENITVHEVDIEHVYHWLSYMISRGYLIDMKVYAALYLAGDLYKWWLL